MLNKIVIILLSIYDGQPSDKFNQYELAKLQLAGLLDDDNQLTPQGEVICLEILSLCRRVL